MGYNMEVANLPAVRAESAVSQDYVDLLIDYLAKGVHPRQLAYRLHPHDRTGRLRAYRRLKRILLDDPRAKVALAEEGNIQMMADLVPIIRAMGTRAKRGRPDAGKLILEASGFHNPKSKIEHSGEIKIKLDMPRPKFDAEGTVADADVVD